VEPDPLEPEWIQHEEVLMADEKKPDVKDEGPVEFVVKHPVVKKPIVAPDGHVVLSQEDIDARNA
jgi:hypothetical protein